jgi:predicted phage terminase large subunit-like protein
MTRWHSDDVIGRLTDPENPCYNEIEAKKWRIIRLPAIAEEDDPIGREVGEPLWPDEGDQKNYDLDFLESQQRLDPLGFAALYQQRPTVADGVLFRRENVRYYDKRDLPDNLNFYAASDHAVKTGQRNDFTVMGKVGVNRQNDIYLTECFWAKVKPDVAVNQMLTMGRGEQRPLLWFAEKDHITGSIAPFLYKEMQAQNTYLNIRELSSAGDKEQKAQSIAALFALGKVYFPKGEPWVERAISELLAFPNGLKDDFVDMIANIGRGLRSQFAASKPAEKPKEPAFGTLDWVKRQDKWATEQRQRADAGGF